MLNSRRSGRSFKGLSQYLSRDPKAQTSERLAWSHTVNLANDHVPSAVHEMYQTFLDAEALKEEAGIKRGGQPLQFPVKHFSLDWHPDDHPSKEHMIETAQAFLLHMGWHEHQAVFHAHEDKAHDHVHVMLNAVHPETGLKLDEGLERRRVSEWSLAYELQQEQIRCEQRLQNVAEREPAPTRAAWETMKEAEQAHGRAEAARRRESDPDIEDQAENGSIWQKLKALQREEREAFFDGGKAAYKEARDAAFRDVREDFRSDWRDYYAAQRDGLDAELLRDIKSGLMVQQQEALTERREQMSTELREQRDADYAALLTGQQSERASFSARVAHGEDGNIVLSELQAARVEQVLSHNDNDPLARDFVFITDSEADRTDGFRSAASEVCEVSPAERSAPMLGDDNEPIRGETRAENPRVKDGIDLGVALGAAAFGEALTFGERLFEGFLDDAPRPTVRPMKFEAEPELRQPDLFSAAANAARRRQAEDEEQAKRDEWWDDRRSRARE